MKVITNIFFFVVLITSTVAQTSNFPKLTKDDLPGIKIIREQTYDGSSLWGYINGGADIFLEFGFDKLLLQEVDINGLNFKIEIYKMNSPASAFGIYSVSHYKCEEKIKSVKYSCITQYQIQCAMNCYYISIINANGSNEEQAASNKIFGKIADKISANGFEPPQLFSNKILRAQKDQLKYFNGILGVQNGIIEWYDYFEGLGKFEIYLLPFTLEDGVINLAQIKFSSGSDVNNFLSRIGIKIKSITKYLTKDDSKNPIYLKMLNNNEMILAEGNISSAKLEEWVKQIW